MSNATEELKDAREANLELKDSLQTLSEKLDKAKVAILSGDRGSAAKAIDFAAKEIDAALGYSDAVHDSHQALSRCLRGDASHG